MIIALAPLIIAIVGLLMWSLSSNPKVQRIGEILFFCGALVVTLGLGSKTVHLF